MSIENSNPGRKKQDQLIRDTLNSLKTEHNISQKDILKYLVETKEKTVPISIFSLGLSPLQAIVKHLVENKAHTFKEISTILRRDPRTIWNTYRAANLKLRERIIPKPTKYTIDLSILSNRKLSVLENICTYLRDHYSLNYHSIALLLAKNDRTVWTVCKRAETKKDERKA
jgi:hypothetical protein